MHELSVCRNLLQQVSRIADEHHASRVERIHLQIGPLSGVVPELLQTAFPIACDNTVAAHAELVIHVLPIRVRCKTCLAITEASANRLGCRTCGAWQTELLSGDELLLHSIELDQAH